MTLTFDYDLDICWVSCGCQGTCYAKFNRAKCSGLWVILHTEKKKFGRKTIQSVATARTIIKHSTV